jgi:arylsulfatase A-like enzyme
VTRTIHLVDELAHARIEAPTPQHVELQTITIGLISQIAIFQHPPSKITFAPLEIGPEAHLHFACGIKQPSWTRMRGSVSFTIHLETEAGHHTLFEQTLDPRRNPAHRSWSEHTLDLSDFTGQSVQFIFQTRANRSAAFAWSGWGDARISDEAVVPEPVPRQVEAAEHHVFLITADALIASFLGCYGHDEVKTPAIDALAGEGWLFTDARAQSTTTLGSYMSMLTGKYPYEHGIDREWGGMPAHLPTLPVLLNGHGYHTVLFSSKDEMDHRSSFGGLFNEVLPSRGNPAQDGSITARNFVRWLQQRPAQPIFGWLHFFDTHPPAVVPAQFSKMYVRPTDSNPRRDLISKVRGVETMLELDDALPMLEEGVVPDALVSRLSDTVDSLRNPGKLGPDLVTHLYALGRRALGKQSPAQFADWLKAQVDALRADDIRPDLVVWLKKLVILLGEIEEEVAGWLELVPDFEFMIAQMKAAVSYFDHHVGTIVTALKTAGLYDSTTIIITAPHGEVLHQDGIVFNHHIPVRKVLQIPLIIKPARNGAHQTGRQIGGVFDSIDLLPTLLDMLALPCGTTSSGQSRWQDISRGEDIPSHDSFAVDALHLISTLYRYPYILMHGEGNHRIANWAWQPGDERLFDLSQSGSEGENQLEALPEIAADLRARLDHWRQAAGLT